MGIVTQGALVEIIQKVIPYRSISQLDVCKSVQSSGELYIVDHHMYCCEVEKDFIRISFYSENPL